MTNVTESPTYLSYCHHILFHISQSMGMAYIRCQSYQGMTKIRVLT